MRVLLSQSNLDPAIYADAQTVRLHRAVNRHIAFGAGVHRCLGLHLARLFSSCVWRCANGTAGSPQYRLADGFQPEFRQGLREMIRLPLEWSDVVVPARQGRGSAEAVWPSTTASWWASSPGSISATWSTTISPASTN